MKLSASLAGGNKSTTSAASRARAKAKQDLEAERDKGKRALARVKDASRSRLVKGGLLTLASLTVTSAAIGYLQGPERITFGGIDGRLIAGGAAAAYGAYALYKGRRNADTILATGLGILGSWFVDYAVNAGARMSQPQPAVQGALPSNGPAYGGVPTGRRVVVATS